MVIVDAGHGGTDPGASSGDIIEKDYTLKISNYMYNRFKELGIPTFITRTTDTTLNPTDRINTITPYVTSSDDIVISNHLNAGGGDGAEVVYALRNDDTLAKSILDNIEATGQNIRKWYQRKLPSNSSKDYYYIIRNTSPAESVLVEYAFLDSTKDDRNQIKNDWEKWAEAVVKAVAEYKGYNYVAPGGNTVNDTYTVQKGDSLWSIAKRFNTTVQKIVNNNGISNPNLIYPGQRLVIAKSTTTIQTKYMSYRIKRGDTLWGIANKYNTTVNELAYINRIRNVNRIYINQVIRIPVNISIGEYDCGHCIYTVRRGDTLSTIANRFGRTVKEIAELNGIKNVNYIYIGQKLRI